MVTPRWHLVCEGWFSPAAASCGEGDVALFGRSARGELMHRRLERGEWGPIISLGVPGGAFRWSGRCPPAERTKTRSTSWPGEPKASCSTGAFAMGHGAGWNASEALRGSMAPPWGWPVRRPPAAVSPERWMSSPSAPRGRCSTRRGMSAGSANSNRWEASRVARAGAAGPWGDRGLFLRPARNGGADRGPEGDVLLKWWNGRRWSGFESLGAPQEPDATYPAVQRAVRLTSAPIACGLLRRASTSSPVAHAAISCTSGGRAGAGANSSRWDGRPPPTPAAGSR
jgi:hypothetical protein